MPEDSVIPADAPTARPGVLLVNLGTPDAPTAPAIRRYLREFLADRRVVEAPRAIWLPVLYGIILPFRPRKLVHAYQSVWTPQGSPLMAASLAQAASLRRLLGEQIPVALGMTYGRPSVESAIDELTAQGVNRVIVLPLYPQYSATTTAAVTDAVFRVLMSRRDVPALDTIRDYHDHPAYIAALADSVRSHWQRHGRDAHLLMSFHSIPQEYVDKGDPYGQHCQRSAALLAQTLGLNADQWSISYQSRLGPKRWLQPYTDEYVASLAQRGIKALDVICPGFAADCLETLEEIAIRYREVFLEAGGQTFRYIPALNADAAHIAMMRDLVQPLLRH
ncbi:MAG: ferrochelatase [Nevskiaceae bacterium]|nr:MAG: ferrochelatase [Nevskiaceae bacterium]